MIKRLKIQNSIYENIEPYHTDENKEKLWNIPNTLEGLKKVALATIRWGAERHLKKTDWVVTKIAEIQVIGGDVEAVKKKYADILTQRETLRGANNKLESKVNACKTFEKLLKVVEDLRI